MTSAGPVTPQPPRWTRALLMLVLSRDSMRDAIVGDLHEEFVDDVVRVGERLAQLRCARRTAGIAAHALADTLLCRAWTSGDACEDLREHGLHSGPCECPPAAAAARSSRSSRSHGAAGDAWLVLVAFVVLMLGIVVNTMLFSATGPGNTRASSAAGVGGVVVFVACAAFAAIVMCSGPRWRRRRLRGT